MLFLEMQALVSVVSRPLFVFCYSNVQEGFDNFIWGSFSFPETEQIGSNSMLLLNICRVSFG